jgi:hypothetical protein
MTKPAPLGFTMKRLTCFAAVTAALFAASGASAATVPLSGIESQRIILHDVKDVSLSFAVPTTGGSANFGGYVIWSSREDGWTDDAGSWGTCLECGYPAGWWDIDYNPGADVLIRSQTRRPVKPTLDTPVNAEHNISKDDLFVTPKHPLR